MTEANLRLAATESIVWWARGGADALALPPDLAVERTEVVRAAALAHEAELAGAGAAVVAGTLWLGGPASPPVVGWGHVSLAPTPAGAHDAASLMAWVEEASSTGAGVLVDQRIEAAGEHALGPVVADLRVVIDATDDAVISTVTYWILAREGLLIGLTTSTSGTAALEELMAAAVELTATFALEG